MMKNKLQNFLYIAIPRVIYVPVVVIAVVVVTIVVVVIVAVVVVVLVGGLKNAYLCLHRVSGFF